MYYQLVDSETGKPADCSLICNKWFKRTLSRLNRESWKVEGRVRYAIACLIPAQACVYQRWKNEDGSQGDLYWSKWINISNLPQEQRQRFWAWYGDSFGANSEVVSASELSIPIGAYSER